MILDNICLICGEKIDVVKTNSNSLFQQSLKRKLETHLKNVHNITKVEYILKYFYNNIRPTCFCGCGMFTNINHSWEFNKYYQDHKNKMAIPNDVRNKISIGLLKHNKITHDYIKEKGLTEEDLKKYFDMYRKPEINQLKLKNICGIDFRTLSRYWIALEICDRSELKQLAKMHKYSLKYEFFENKNIVLIDENILTEIYLLLSKTYNNKELYTLDKIISDFNLNISKYILYKRLCEKFGQDSINLFLGTKNSSKPENNFYFVLCYFFGKKNIKRQFKLNQKVYDFLLFDKILIEFDGEYWHSFDKNKKNDEIKDKIAMENGYIIFRVKDKIANKIENFIKIRNLINEINRD